MKRNIDKEVLAIAYEKAGESVCGVTFDSVRKEAIEMAKTPGFLPQHMELDPELLEETVLVLIELTAFAAMNVIRRENGMPELVDRDADA